MESGIGVQRYLFGALISLSLIWGGSFFFIKILLNDFGPWAIAFLRSSFGLLIIVTIMFVLRKPFEFRNIKWMPMAVIAVLNTSIPWALIGFSETKLTSNIASVLNATTPLWTLILGVLLFRAVTNKKQWIGMGLAFVGLLIMIGFNPVTIIEVDLIGFICMLAATFCYALGSQLSKRINGLTMYQITFGTLLCSMLASGVVAFAVEPIPFVKIIAIETIIVLIGLGVFGSGIAYLLFYFMIQKGSPEYATMVTYLVPASAIVWGSTLLNEPINVSLLLGLAFILCGVYLVNKKSQPMGKQIELI